MMEDITGRPWRKDHEIAAVVHLYYSELFEEIASYLQNLGLDCDLYFTIPFGEEHLTQQIRDQFPAARIVLHQNRGRDILPFLNILKLILPLHYSLLVKIHSKMTLHREGGDAWRKDVFDRLLGSLTQVEKIKTAFQEDVHLGMLGPSGHVLNTRFYMGLNGERFNELLQRTGIGTSKADPLLFVASTMFWCRPEILKPLLRAELKEDDFEAEPLPDDGSTAHTVERLLGVLPTLQGYALKQMDVNGRITIPDPYHVFEYASIPAYLRLRNLQSVVFYRTYDIAYAIEYLRITAPFRQAGMNVILGIVDGVPDLDRIALGDAVIIQREFPSKAEIYDEIIWKARELGKFIIYEIDDLLFDLPEGHPDKKNEVYSKDLMPMLSAVTEADLVIVSTAGLREMLKGANPNIVVLPNYLDDQIWHLQPPKEEVPEILTIGYMGSDSHTPDLDSISQALIDLMAKYKDKLKFKVWGTPLPESLKDLAGVDWQPSPSSVYVDFVEFFQKQSVDIFIAPLVDNLFNSCKSNLKYLEYGAMGTPGVFSAVTPYTQIVEGGVDGLLATTQDEWNNALESLIVNPSLRKQIAEKAQEKVKNHWLLSKNISSWLCVFGQLPEDRYQDISSRPMAVHLVNTIRRQVVQWQKNLQMQSQSAEAQAHNLRVQIEEERELIHRILEVNRALFDQNEELSEKLDAQYNQAAPPSVFEDQYSVEVEQLKRQVNEAQAEINKIYSSNTWKLLSPLRATRRALNRFVVIAKSKSGFAGKLHARMKLKQDTDRVVSSGLFDSEYYLTRNADVKNAKVNPTEHFILFGGSEGRSPSEQFDSSWYLSQYPDVKNTGVNPLLHYIRYGKTEGRLALPPTVNLANPMARDRNIDSALINSRSLVPDRLILAPELKILLDSQLKANFHLVLSHDDYLNVTGGSQVSVADEQERTNVLGISYLQIYPYIKGKRFTSGDRLEYIGVSLDGIAIGFTEIRELCQAVSNLKDRSLDKVIIHHSMGFTYESVQRVLDLAGKRGVFWLHDYFSLCPSYNLLRNDTVFCGAPELNSNECAICHYLPARREQVDLFEKLFSQNQLEVAAPSRFTYELWQNRFPIHPERVAIIPPARLEWQHATQTGFQGGVMRVGFLGYPLAYKGWDSWTALTSALVEDKRYKFYHFSAQACGPGNYKHVNVRVTKDDRNAMLDAVRKKQIDAVILWSQVAETFSFTLHEALAAGAYILTNPQSGNIQSFIHRNPYHGLIVEDESALIALFQNGTIVQKVKDYHQAGRPQANLIIGGFQEAVL